MIPGAGSPSSSSGIGSNSPARSSAHIASALHLIMAYNRFAHQRQFDTGPLRTETELEGVISSFTFESKDGTYSVAKLDIEGEERAVVIVGPLAGVQAGERIRVTGRWTRHPRFGQQFALDSFIPVLPSTLTGLEAYLGSGLVKGIRKGIARRIIDKFGDDTYRILEQEPERLVEVRGVGRKTAEALAELWETHKAVHDIMIFLQGIGITPALAARLYKQYGKETAQILRTNPYRIALEVRQVGFRTADRIAEKMGIGRDAPQRAEAGIVHVLTEALGEGHTFLPAPDLVRASAEMLGIDEDLVAAALERLEGDRRIMATSLPEGERAVFAPALYICESSVALYLRSLVETGKPFPQIDVEGAVRAFEATHSIEFAPEQRDAVRQACAGGCLVVTGGPGTGKTTLVRAVIQILEEESVEIQLCAPTGRAAQRLSETTGRNASTIHRLLKYSPDTGFFHNQHNPLRLDLLIVDETSMVDIALGYHLLRALPPSASVLFVGDVDQLPSVGPGNFLRDLIEARVVPVVRLERIFRQSQRSLIVVNAHRINHGEYPIVPKPVAEKEKPPDFFFVNQPDPEECVRVIQTLLKERIPERFGFDPVQDVQVLTPMRKGILGVDNLNEVLQGLLNDRSGGWARGRTVFKVGDKVMQLVNNYDLDVFNGDVGIIVTIDRELRELRVRYGHRIVTYSTDALEEITLAYACTIHKSQGSEYKAVVIPIHTQHFVLLQRNLLYTAVTRGKRLVCLVGSPRAVWMAIRNVKTRERFSALRQWLVSGIPGEVEPPIVSDDDLARLE